MKRRRLFVACCSLSMAFVLWWLMWRALAPGGWTLAKAVMMGSFGLASLWVGLCFTNGAVGLAAAIAWRAADRGAVAPSAGTGGRIAIVMTVRNEPMALVLPALRRLLDALDAAEAGERFAVFILSDSSDASEESAVDAFRATDPARIRYRRRTENTRLKAGNIMDFLDHHADGFEMMLVLDADSEMSAQAVLRLAREMDANPHLAIVQHLTVALPAASAFPRLFQFGMRAGMRTWAAALDWWQGDECCYWGHNALVRIAPFRTHCRLPLLPDGQPILSHDQVEAALLTGAGWGVRLLPEEDGSLEANPPALPEFMRRELRWLAGNLEYRHLLTMPGLRPMGRWQLVQAILLFGCTPFYLVLLLAAAVAAVSDTTSGFPAGRVLAVTLAWFGAIYAPKLLGYAQVLATAAMRSAYGGAVHMVVGIAAETAFTLLLDAVSVVSKTGTTLRLMLGMRPAWLPQNRSDRGISWGEAARLLWVHTAVGVLAFAAFGYAGWRTVLWATPLAGGLVLAIPFCVLTASPRFSAWLRRHRVAATPEELLTAPLAPAVGAQAARRV
jgi:membrane glycosyltransferase